MKVLVAGDFCQRYRVDEIIASKKYNTLFDEVRSVIERADYSIVNFEFPIVLPTSKAVPISKCGPTLKGTANAADAVKYCGFKCCTLANNHVLDQGVKCCIDTNIVLNDIGLDTVGVGENLEEASKVLYKEINGEKIAIINCCEHEFSIATESTVGAAPLDPILQFYKIQEAKQHVDYVLVIVHAGHEHYQLPSMRMQRTYRFFVDAGADAVVNHHQHCYSGYEVYNGKPIFYGLGNFCFDEPNKRETNWNQGYMVSIHFKKGNIEYQLIPYLQCTSSPGVFPMDKECQKSFMTNIQYLCSIISDEEKLLSAEKKYYTTNYKRQIFMFEPYQNRILDKLFDLKLLPTTLSQQRLLRILNSIMCESHRDKLITALKLNLLGKNE